MSTITKDLGVVTAYGYYKAGGGTMTESEFTQFMVDFGTASKTATEAAQAAAESAQASAARSADSQDSAEEARQSASIASTRAIEADTAAGASIDAKNDAVTAKTAAETAQGKAEDAQAAAESVAESIPSDYSQLSEDVTELKSGLNNVRTGSEFLWELGTLTPGTGAEQTGDTRVRSVFIPVTTGSVITLEDQKSRLLVYSYNANKQYIADSPWLGSNAFTVADVSDVHTEWVRILIRKNTSNAQISDSEIADLVAGLEIKYPLPSNTAAEIRKISDLEKSLNGSRYITDLEIGGMTDGKPYKYTAYIRPKNFIRVNAGDVLVVHPTTFGLYNSAIYKYNTDNASGYTTSVTIPATTAGKTWKHTFTEDGWFKFRASNASSGAKINPEDLLSFNDVFCLEHLYDADELMGVVGALGIDYDSINASINGKFNIAVQTDTHMSKYTAYTSAEYLPSNFDDLRSVVNAINKLDIDLFANLGDFIRGYQADPDYESRENADAILECYKKINTNKAFVIGNHDDGCLYYSDLAYNDKQSIYQVMYPNEQFNRYTKFGLNQMGVKNYYYADIQGVRIITLYQRDFDYSQAIPGIESFKISSEQIDWLTNTALSTDLPVIVLTHAPLLSSLYANSREGFDVVLTALTNFRTNGGTVIAVLSGHTHAQATQKVDGINHIVFKNGYTMFELISVDLVNRTISCKAINGSTTDLSLTY